MALSNSDLRIESLTFNDLGEVARLQPEGWPDIFPSIQYYCTSDFCFPIKAILDENLVGIGTAIILGQTAWLAHIIVHSRYRNLGIGSTITQHLVDFINRTSCQSILLIATNLGEPVYRKIGFEVETEYLFLENELFLKEAPSKYIVSFEKKYESDLLELDRAVSGEHRKKLFDDHLSGTLLFIENNTLKGFYISTLGEGLIIADEPHAGIELMKIRLATQQKICLPDTNQNGINFLIENGFKEFRKASRMILGERLSWHGNKLYSRIGGNLG